MEDAYAFTSSFVAQPFSKEQIEEASVFSEPDSSLSVVKSIADRSPIKYFEIDFESLDAFLKKMEKSYPDEEAVRKAAKQLV